MRHASFRGRGPYLLSNQEYAVILKKSQQLYLPFYYQRGIVSPRIWKIPIIIFGD